MQNLSTFFIFCLNIYHSIQFCLLIPNMTLFSRFDEIFIEKNTKYYEGVRLCKKRPCPRKISSVHDHFISCLFRSDFQIPHKKLIWKMLSRALSHIICSFWKFIPQGLLTQWEYPILQIYLVFSGKSYNLHSCGIRTAIWWATKICFAFFHFPFLCQENASTVTWKMTHHLKIGLVIFQKKLYFSPKTFRNML